MAGAPNYDRRVPHTDSEPLSRRQTYLRRRIAVFTALGVVLATGFYLPLTLLAPLPAVSPTVQTLEIAPAAPAALDWPTTTASGVGAVGFDGVLASTGSTEPLPIASITKIVTALVVLEQHPIAPGTEGASLTFGPSDVAIRQALRAVNGVVAPMSNGMTLSQRAIMQVMLVESANNYAASLAAWAFGSEAGFVEAANAWLDRKGLTATVLTDATGMSPANRSTPADLIELGKLALADPLVAEIVASRSVSVPGVGTYDNRNRLLAVDGVTGIKTGTLDEAGACLLFAADITVGSSTVTTVGVVLGGVDHASLALEASALLADIRDGFHEVVLVEAGDPIGSYETAWGSTVGLEAATSATTVVWSDAAVSTTIETDDVRAAAGGTDLGDLVFAVGDQSIAVDLVLSSAIDDPGPWWRLGNPFELF